SLGDCPHRSLPSFPTRRSSDLTIMTPMSGGFDWLAVGDVAEERVAASGPGILGGGAARLTAHAAALRARTALVAKVGADEAGRRDRKSTRLNSSHSQISYAVFC